MKFAVGVLLLIGVFSPPGACQGQEGTRPYLAFPGMSVEEAAASQQAAVQHFGLPSSLILELAGAAEIEMVLLPPGEFMMGGLLSPEETARVFGGPPGLFELEHPRHPVRMTEPVYVARFEVTRRQWHVVMGGPQPSGAEAELPAEGVTWDEAQEFTQALSALVGQPVRLISEAEWEFACRAGSTGEFFHGDSLPPGVANVETNRVRPVGTFPANAWGLHDMLGNVVEWVNDWYGHYPDSARTDPVGPEFHYGRMLRGGSFDRSDWHARCSYRYAHLPSRGDQRAGVRLAITPHR